MVPSDATARTHPLITLPLELIITIIEELVAHKYNDALCAFSLVCSSLVPICRKHIFHTFDMRTGSQCARGWQIVNKFAWFLSQHLHLVPYVRAVHILVAGSTRELHWIYTTSSLAYIIRLLTSLHTFELIVTTKSSWNPLPISLKEALCIMVCRYNLHTLRFTGMTDIPLLLFTHARRLKSFHAHQVSCHVGLKVCHHDQIFEELSLGHSTHLLNILLENAYLDLSRLRKITIDISSKPTDIKLSWSLIGRAGDSLQHLEFRHSDVEHGVNFFCFKHSSLAATPRLLPFITLQPHTALESFSFTVLFIGDAEECLLSDYEIVEDDSDSEPTHQMSSQFFLSWCHLLRTAPSSLRLITITMYCYGLHNDVLRDWFDISDSSKWSDLDLILANSERLPLLQKVLFYVNLPDTGWDESDSDYDSEEDDALLDNDDSESNVDDGCHTGWDESDSDNDGDEMDALLDDEEDDGSELEAPVLSLEEAAYFIRRNLKLTRRVALVEVLAGD